MKNLRNLIIGVGVAIAILIGAAGQSGAATTLPAAHSSGSAAYQLFDNGTESDCTVAAAGNLAAVWNPTGNLMTAETSVQAAWKALGAPVDGMTADHLLTYWEHHAIAGYKIRSRSEER